MLIRIVFEFLAETKLLMLVVYVVVSARMVLYHYCCLSSQNKNKVGFL